MSTKLPFDVEGALIILVDDVLYTGRSLVGAADAAEVVPENFQEDTVNVKAGVRVNG